MNPFTERRAARRLVVKDLHIQGLPPKEIAERIGCCLPTIYKDFIALGLRKKGTYSPPHREAIAKGVRKAKGLGSTGPKFCCLCGRQAREKFQKKWWCDIHLARAGADPDHDKKQCAAAGQRHASHGRTEP